MNNLTTVLLVILAVLVVLLVVLYFLGNRMQKRQAEQQELLDAAKQTVSILVIDKKRLPLKESGLPKQVIEQTPWYAKRSKLPIVKAKVGPRVMTLIAQDTAFEQCRNTTAFFFFFLFFNLFIQYLRTFCGRFCIQTAQKFFHKQPRRIKTNKQIFG